MTSFMRAQDMWLGFPYDINLLLSLFQLMSNRLKIEMGEYNHYCDVLRVYESNYQDVAKLTPHFSNASKDIDFNGICDFEKIKHYRDLIKNLPDNILEIIKDEPEYWKNGIKACYAYKLIQEKKYEQAHQVIDSITNGLKEQFEIWASYYHHFFFEIAN